MTENCPKCGGGTADPRPRPVAAVYGAAYGTGGHIGAEWVQPVTVTCCSSFHDLPGHDRLVFHPNHGF